MTCSLFYYSFFFLLFYSLSIPYFLEGKTTLTEVTTNQHIKDNNFALKNSVTTENGHVRSGELKNTDEIDAGDMDSRQKHVLLGSTLNRHLLDIDLYHHNNLLTKDAIASITPIGRNNLLKEQYAALGIYAGTLPRSEVAYNYKSFTKDQHILTRPDATTTAPYWKGRRRSSTGDVRALTSLSSDDKALGSDIRVEEEEEMMNELINSKSCPCLDIYQEEERHAHTVMHVSEQGDVLLSGPNCEMISGSGNEIERESGKRRGNGQSLQAKQPSIASGTPSSASSSTTAATSSGCGSYSVEEEEERQHKKRRRVHRFSSCPEYVFTQRMSVTNDESLLIEGT